MCLKYVYLSEEHASRSKFLFSINYVHVNIATGLKSVSRNRTTKLVAVSVRPPGTIAVVVLVCLVLNMESPFAHGRC